MDYMDYALRDGWELEVDSTYFWDGSLIVDHPEAEQPLKVCGLTSQVSTQETPRVFALIRNAPRMLALLERAAAALDYTGHSLAYEIQDCIKDASGGL
jgi:hypothetical protein